MTAVTNRINFFPLPPKDELPTLHEYNKLRSIGPSDMTPGQYQRYKLCESAMLSRNVINKLASRMHEARKKQILAHYDKKPDEFKRNPGLTKIDTAKFEKDIHSVLDLIRKSDRNCIQQISEFFLKEGYTEKDVDGSIKRLFVLNPEFDTPNLAREKLEEYPKYGPKQAVGVMSTFLSNEQWKKKLVSEAVDTVMRKNPHSFADKAIAPE
ncbi:MAG: hypothetical protein WCX64_00190 [Candidatus Micrarchaeia archaeon]